MGECRFWCCSHVIFRSVNLGNDRLTGCDATYFDACSQQPYHNIQSLRYRRVLHRNENDVATSSSFNSSAILSAIDANSNVSVPVCNPYSSSGLLMTLRAHSSIRSSEGVIDYVWIALLLVSDIAREVLPSVLVVLLSWSDSERHMELLLKS